MNIELACIAALLNLAAPVQEPKIVEVPLRVVEIQCGANHLGCYQNSVAYIPEGRIRDDVRVHELAHYVQSMAGVDMTDWRIENAASFVAAKYPAFCR